MIRPPEIDWTAARVPGIGPEGAIVVTGAGGAMGRATTHALIELGAVVVCVGRSRSSLEETVKTSAEPSRGHALPADIASQDDLRRLVASLRELPVPVRGLVNCAAVSDGADLAMDVDIDVARQVFEVNYFGALAVSTAVAGLMREADGGRVVHVSSVAKHRAMPGGSQYGASKAALTRLVRSLAVEWGPDGIRVNLISPGQTPTPLTPVGTIGASAEPPPQRQGASASTVPVGRRGALSDYVGAIVFLLSDLSAYVTGHDLAVEGGVMWRRPTG